MQPSRVRRRPLVGVTLGVLAAMILAGCSSAEQSADGSSQVSTDRQAGGVLGTRVCIYNNSSAMPSVYFTQKANSGGEGQLQRGSVACADGWSPSPAQDVIGRIDIPGNPGHSLRVEGRNPGLGTPTTRLSEERNDNLFFCVGTGGFKVGERQTWDDGVLAFTVSRLPDEQWKRFNIDIYNTSNPSSNGQPRGCPVQDTGADSPTQ